ncbi:phosphoribosylamine--glycine ligase [Candidatus Acetothermia bacterium]|jgi:phosphoribosylamine--glycine ligase|nr:phosphoribosylamine--glycine ligase [Candidatus Acetothermia bacterium]MCI2431811.1 phosphoribosylamine--glycine ligase [Candidatus Acetothermia bacterium]MCI2435737.1 phosphoribosylamine--glycine ligase [Candidatus Acetothermia bacterium]
MKILLIGSGGREHALAWGLAQSPKLSKLYIAPGNAGTAQLGQNIPIGAENLSELAQFARREQIDLTIVGPEAPIVAGIRDPFERENLKIIAPTQKASFLEGSKVQAKAFLHKHGIPTARHASFTDFGQAAAFAQTMQTPLVIKADGLAAGKGVAIAQTHPEAEQILRDFIISKKFGAASGRVVIEDFLVGREFSLFVASDGVSWRLLGAAQDYKRLLDGDCGPNTGGIGSISPVPWLTKEMLDETVRKIVAPTFEALRAENIGYEGILYFGLIWTENGPYVIEYNVRFGDPETQVLVPRFDFDLLELYRAIAERRLERFETKLKPLSTVCVVLASGGYPEQYERGCVIEGLEALTPPCGHPSPVLTDGRGAGGEGHLLVFHAGTALKDGTVVTAGGRVLNIIGFGSSVSEARERAYAAIAQIRFQGMHYRRDIGS